MTTIPLVASVLVAGTLLGATLTKGASSRWAGVLQGVALQMIIVIPIVLLQLTGFVWKNSWSIDFKEAVEVFPLSILFSMAGWTVITPFEWLVPKRQTWVFSNLGEYGTLWATKVILVAVLLAWRREKRSRFFEFPTLLILVALFLDAWLTRDFPWWGT